MKIRYLTGPNAGQTAHVPNDQNTQLLINLGSIEIVTEAPPAPLPVEFGLIHGFTEKRCTLRITCPNCKRTDYYVGRPDKESLARDLFPRLCVHAKVTEVPEATRKAYADAWVPQPLGWSTGVPGITASSAHTRGEQRYGVDESTGKIRK